MVPDSSVIVAIHLREPGYERLIDAIDGADVVAVGIPTLLETAMVLTSRLGYDARPMIHAFLRRLDAQLVPFDEEHLDAAITAFLRFGRGRHPVGFQSALDNEACTRIPEIEDADVGIGQRVERSERYALTDRPRFTWPIRRFHGKLGHCSREGK